MVILTTVPNLVAACQVSDHVHSVHLNVLIVQVPVPLPVGMGAVLKSQDSMSIGWLTKGRPGRLGCGAEVAIIHICGAEATRLVCRDSLVGSWTQPWRVGECLICNHRKT